MIKRSTPLLLTALSASLLSLQVSAGTMGDAAINNQLLFEAGGSYTYSIFKGNTVNADTYTVATPSGVSIHPSNFYPNNFFGGYIELSLLKDILLFNARYDMFALETKKNAVAGTRVRYAPAKLSFSVDRVWGSVNALSYGAGAGVVLQSLNEGQSFNTNLHTLPNGQYINPVQGKSIQGRNRIDPLVEAFAMYNIGNNFNVRWNVAYQIPVNSFFTNGSINTNLGINYALPW